MKGQHSTQIKALSVLYVIVSLGAILGWYSIGDQQYFLHCVWKLTHEQSVSVYGFEPSLVPWAGPPGRGNWEMRGNGPRPGQTLLTLPEGDGVGDWVGEARGLVSWVLAYTHRAKIRDIIILFWLIDGNLSSKSLLIHQIQRASWSKQPLKRITDHS